MTPIRLHTRRQAVGYTEDHTQMGQQCRDCQHCQPSQLKTQAARSDRHCRRLKSHIKAQGTCSQHMPAEFGAAA